VGDKGGGTPRSAKRKRTPMPQGRTSKTTVDQPTWGIETDGKQDITKKGEKKGPRKGGREARLNCLSRDGDPATGAREMGGPKRKRRDLKRLT